MMQNLKRVVVGVSGGVDSSVTALLLKHRGFDVVGLFMKNWDTMDEMGTQQCSSEQDAEDAYLSCRNIGIPFRTVSFVKEYWLDVFSSMLTEYGDGYTPNPDILCNRFIKFGQFLNYSQNELGADLIAFGHYAKHSYGDYFENFNMSEDPQILIPVDRKKDQTAFLSQITTEALRYSMFPLGSLLKSTVKTIAQENELNHVLKRKESMGICFVGKKKFQDFIGQYIDPTPGSFIDIETGVVVGHHDGIHTLTLGQNCRIGGLNRKYYVVSKNVKTQDIFVACDTNHPSLYHKKFFVAGMNWIGSLPVEWNENKVLDCSVRLNNAMKAEPCRINQSEGEFFVSLSKPLRAVSPGQYATFYSSNRCLGSGKVVRLGPSHFETGETLDPKDWEYPPHDQIHVTNHRELKNP